MDAKAIFVPMLWQNSLNFSESNCFPLSTEGSWYPKSADYVLPKEFFTVSEVILPNGLASIHLVKILGRYYREFVSPAMVVVG
jgi:hypothetical protein